MKNIILKISILFLAITVTMISVFTIFSNADSIAGINCPSSVITGKNYTISLNLPSDAYAAQADIIVEYPDGSTETKKIVYVSDMSEKNPNSASFTAKGTGTAKVSATGIRITKSDATVLENGGSKSATIKIKSNDTVVNNTSSNNQNTSSTNTSSNSSSSTSSDSVTFTDVNEKVYTTERCNIRASYSTSSSKLGTVSKGTALTRTGVGSNGWSRIVYNGNTAYITSQYITTTDPNTATTNTTVSNTTNNTTSNSTTADVTFKDTNDTMYAVQNCNVRKGPSTDTDKVGGLEKGQEVTRTGTSTTGWSRIKYNGTTAYVATRLLSKEKPNEEVQNEVDTENTITNEVNTDITNSVDNVLTNEQKLAIIQEEVGVLPEVGINYATVAYIVITAFAIIVACVILYKKENN